jgi:hypothetical protein
MQRRCWFVLVPAGARAAARPRLALLLVALVATGCEVDPPSAVEAGLPVADGSAEAGALALAEDARSAGWDAHAELAADPSGQPISGPSTGAGASAGGPHDRDAASSERVDDGATPAIVGQDDAGVVPPPLETDGKPLDEATDDWTYVEFPETQCRDGSAAAIMVKRGTDAHKLVIYLEGGGQCSDLETCSANPFFASTWVLVMGVFAATGGIFDFDNPENPLRTWNFVYVPYCTGDRHWGGNADANVPEAGPQRFVGYLNLKKFLKRIVPTFRDATDVLLTGISAGGFGVLGTSTLVQRAFPNVKVKTINDSGPVLSAPVYAPCWHERHRTLWKLEQTILADCGQACLGESEFGVAYPLFVARTFADRPTGLIASTGDFVERSFYGIGNDQCTNKLAPLFLAEPGISQADYRSSLMAFRERIRPFANAGTFFLENDEHTWIASDAFYSTNVGGVRLVDWFSKIVRGEPAGHAGP